MWDAAAAAAMGGRLTRVFRTLNVESRARREISKEKPTPAPRHPTSRLDALTGESRLHRGGCSEGCRSRESGARGTGCAGGAPQRGDGRERRGVGAARWAAAARGR